jgi:hypothetical protein
LALFKTTDQKLEMIEFHHSAPRKMWQPTSGGVQICRRFSYVTVTNQIFSKPKESPNVPLSIEIRLD